MVCRFTVDLPTSCNSSWIVLLVMKITCDFAIDDRLLSSLNMKSRHKSTHAQLSIGRKPSSSSEIKNDGPQLMVCTAKNRAGNKYLLKGNVAHVFSRLCAEGKLTIRLKSPEHDLIISNCDPLKLKSFVSLLKAAASGFEVPIEQLSTLVSASCKDVAKPQSSMRIQARKDYPTTSNFPKTLVELSVNGVALKKFDCRILELKNLRCLDLCRNAIRDIPTELNQLLLMRLLLSENQIASLPLKLFVPPLSDHLEELSIAHNSVCVLPPTIVCLSALRDVWMHDNRIKALPFGLCSIQSLRSIRAQRNQIQRLPADFVRLHNLDVVNVSENPFADDGNSVVLRQNLESPTLVELAARAVKPYNVHYTVEDLPRSLVLYLKHGRKCVCGSWCFQSFARYSTKFDLRRVADVVIRLNFRGSTMAPVEAYLCSDRCLRRYMVSPLAYWRRK